MDTNGGDVPFPRFSVSLILYSLVHQAPVSTSAHLVKPTGLPEEFQVRGREKKDEDLFEVSK